MVIVGWEKGLVVGFEGRKRMVCGGGGGWGKYFEEKDGCGTRGDWKAIWEYGGGWLWEMRRRDGLLGLR
uniref:Uncharacterized protein n=1 Tax=Knipowitschia caucasica TaxID=637954 RepID=A0AAV2JQC1_KNICA